MTEEMRQGKMERVGWAKQWKINTDPPTHTHTHTHTGTTYSISSAALVKGKSGGKDLQSVNDGYMSCRDALCTDSLVRRCGGHREGASRLSSLISQTVLGHSASHWPDTDPTLRLVKLYSDRLNSP